MKILIFSPEKTIFQGEAYSLRTLGMDGYFELLDHHAPMISIIKEGPVNLYISKNQKADPLCFHIKNGLLEVKENTVTILTD